MHESFDNTISGNNIKSVKLRDRCGVGSFATFEFGVDGKLCSDSPLKEHLCCATDAIEQLCKEAVEKMAEELGWRNRKVDLRIGILRYFLTPKAPAISNMPYHQDDNTLTMTTLITPYNSECCSVSVNSDNPLSEVSEGEREGIQGISLSCKGPASKLNGSPLSTVKVESGNFTNSEDVGKHKCKKIGFKGGELSIVKKKTMTLQEECNRYFEEKAKPEEERDKTYSYAIEKTTMETFAYPYNGGFIFDNLESKHRVNDITLWNPENIPECSVERRLLTVFADPPEAYVRALGSRNACSLYDTGNDREDRDHTPLD